MPELIQKQKFVFDKVTNGNIVMRVMNFLIQNPDEDFTITQIVEGAEVGRTTLWKGLLSFMMDEGLVIKSRVIGNAKLYKLNKKDEKVKALISLYKVLGGENV